MSEQEVRQLPWWELEKLLTEEDKLAIQRAIYQRWEDIDMNSVETVAGKVKLESIISSKRHRQEWLAGML